MFTFEVDSKKLYKFLRLMRPTFDSNNHNIKVCYGSLLAATLYVSAIRKAELVGSWQTRHQYR